MPSFIQRSITQIHCSIGFHDRTRPAKHYRYGTKTYGQTEEARRGESTSPLPNAVRRAKLGGGGALANAADLVRLARALPGVVDYPHFERRAFKARVTFATLAPDGLTANLKFSPDEQMLKCAVAPDTFAPLDNAWGRRGWTRATLAALSEAELVAALDMAWRHAAPRSKKRASPQR